MRLFLGLGSNLGDRLASLRYARSEVTRLIALAPVESAALYESPPLDCPPGSAPFLNTVLAGTTALAPGQILACAQSIEAAAGRLRTSIRNAPRPLDIDILLLGDLILDTEALVIPHPRLHLRRFVLHPLADLAPDRVIPGLGATVSQLCAAFPKAETPPARLASCW